MDYVNESEGVEVKLPVESDHDRRRLRRFFVGEDFLLRLFTSGHAFRFEACMPKTARVAWIAYSEMGAGFQVYVHDPSFAVVPPGAAVPDYGAMDLTVRHYPIRPEKDADAK